MKCLPLIIFILLTIFLSWSKGTKLVCYYDIGSASKAGTAKFTTKDMELALQFCTHVIYRYVTITPKKYTLTALTPERENEISRMQYFKQKYRNIKFLLSISGDNNPKTIKEFLNLLEADRYKIKVFINSVMKTLIKYKFDGVSLEFPLPTVKPNPRNTFYSKLWFNFKNVFKINSENDSKVSEHKVQLTTLIKKLSTNLRERQGMLTLNVLPNIDPRKYFDIAEIMKSLDFVVISAFDFYTPNRNPQEANLMSPTKPLEESDGPTLTNIKSLYKHWHSQNVPRHKIIIGIAAFGRAWKTTKNSNSNGVPPVLYTDGPAAAGPETHTPGFLSWPEICKKLARDPKITRVTDSKAKTGVYAFRPADSRGNFGIWISYEDPITTAAKALYVRNHNLGGVALISLDLDDVHGECSGEKFPILRSIKFRLTRFLA